MIDRKSQKLTNILLFIIVCFFVLGALCTLGRAAFNHAGFGGRMGGYMMQGQYKNVYKFDEGKGCPYVDEKIDVVTNAVVE
ncbi:MAG: hypothetical protein WAZ12_02915 [Candidatus Absconditicoccaceae bacterium]